MNENLERSINRLVDLVSLIAVCIFWPFILGLVGVFIAFIYMLVIQPTTWITAAIICAAYFLSSRL